MWAHLVVDIKGCSGHRRHGATVPHAKPLLSEPLHASRAVCHRPEDCAVLGLALALVGHVGAGDGTDAGSEHVGFLLCQGGLNHKLGNEHKWQPHKKDGQVHVEEPPEQDKVGGHCSTKVTLHLLDVGPPQLNVQSQFQLSSYFVPPLQANSLVNIIIKYTVIDIIM